jgi:hypothetical protein
MLRTAFLPSFVTNTQVRLARLTRRPTSHMRSHRSLDLLGLRLLSSLLSLDFTAALVALHGAQCSERSEYLALSSVANSFELSLVLSVSNRQHVASDLMAGSRGLELLGGRVIDETTLGFASTTWEQDELVLVRVQALNIQLQLFLRSVGSPVIN